MEQSPLIIPALSQPDRCMYTWQECPVPSLWGYVIQRDHCITTQQHPPLHLLFLQVSKDNCTSTREQY